MNNALRIIMILSMERLRLLKMEMMMKMAKVMKTKMRKTINHMNLEMMKKRKTYLIDLS